jgi:hypothetical protein
MTADLATELSIKRIHRHEETRKGQIEEALAEIQVTLSDEPAHRAEAIPSAALFGTNNTNNNHFSRPTS